MNPLITLLILVFVFVSGFVAYQGNCLDCVFADHCDCECSYDFSCSTYWDADGCRFTSSKLADSQGLLVNNCLLDGEVVPKAPESGCIYSRESNKVSYKCGFEKMNNAQKCFLDCSPLRSPMRFQLKNRFLELSPASFSCLGPECIARYEYEDSSFSFFSDSTSRFSNTCEYWQIFNCSGSLCKEFQSVYHLTISADNYSEISCPDYWSVIHGGRVDQSCKEYIQNLSRSCPFKIL